MIQIESDKKNLSIININSILAPMSDTSKYYNIDKRQTLTQVNSSDSLYEAKLVLALHFLASRERNYHGDITVQLIEIKKIIAGNKTLRQLQDNLKHKTRKSKLSIYGLLRCCKALDREHKVSFTTAKGDYVLEDKKTGKLSGIPKTVTYRLAPIPTSDDKRKKIKPRAMKLISENAIIDFDNAFSQERKPVTLLASFKLYLELLCCDLPEIEYKFTTLEEKFGIGKAYRNAKQGEKAWLTRTESVLVKISDSLVKAKAIEGYQIIPSEESPKIKYILRHP